MLEIYVGDLDTFADLVPDDWLSDPEDDRPPLDERLRRFSQERLQIITDEGVKLEGRLEVAEPRLRVDRRSPFAGMINPYTRQRVPAAPADKRVLYVEIVYPFAERPEALTFVPPLDDEGRAIVTIGFIAYHKSVPIIDFRYLGAPAHVQLNWADPWYTVFDNPNLKRHHKSAMMSFLYVEPWEVRHEILTRVKDLQQWLDFDLASEDYIEADELEALKQRIGEFLLARNIVRIDGAPARPILDRVNFIEVGLSGITLLESPKRLEMSTAIVGVIISYLTDGIPQTVTVDWDLFTDDVRRVPVTATDPAGPLPSFLEPGDKVHTWTNYLKNYRLPTIENVQVRGTFGEFEVPLASLFCVAVLLPLSLWRLRRNARSGVPIRTAVFLVIITLGFGVVAFPYARVTVQRPAAVGGHIDPEQAAALLETLLKNVYRAFDFREEADVYDKLALTVDGDLLTDIYLQHRRSFAVKKAGGAQAKVTSVEVSSATAQALADSGRRATIRGQWNVSGTVGHWGHVHVRGNSYDAVIELVAVDGHWKIARMDVVEERRVDPGASGTPAATGSAR